MELIVAHINADFDALASMVAARKLYPRASLIFAGAQEKKVREFIAEMFPLETLRIKDVDHSKVTRLVVVDTKSPDRLAELAPLLTQPEVEVHVYDHHTHEAADIHGALETLEPVGATVTIMAELLQRDKLTPSPLEATLMLLGIYQETGAMLYPTTTPRDLEAAAWLLQCGANLNIVSNYLKTELGLKEIEALSQLSHSARETVIKGLKVVTAKATSETYIGDAAHLAHRIMDMQFTDAVVIMLDMEGKVLMVGRSRNPALNIADVLAEFGGGGHPTAASATVKEMPLEVLEERLLSVLDRVIKPGRFAEDVMTSPVITIDATATMADAEAVMTMHEINALPVIEEGQYHGIITRELVEKSIYHGLSSRPLGELATTDALTATRYTAVSEVETGMIERNQRFMPVLEDRKVIGAITRTDLLRAMYDDNLRRSGIKSEGVREDGGLLSRDISKWIESRLDPRTLALLKDAGATASGLGMNAYLVGGSVRDMVRGQEPGEREMDLDVVIEGDGIAFARKFAAQHGARVHVHTRFGTAAITLRGQRMDVATSRTEYYETPGALPKVQTSSIKKDLYRRDFTINTLAMKLNPGEFGTLVDFFGAQRDLKEKTVRVLHNLSFVEDPTRAFRAVRFAERFGFKLSKHTENLIKTTLKMDLFARLTGSRIYDEFALIFMEKEPVPALMKLAEYGLFRVIHPRLEMTEELRQLLTSVHNTLLWFDMLFTEERPDRVLIYLTALLSGLEESDKDAALEHLSVPPKVRHQIVRATEEVRQVLRRLPTKDPALIHEALSPLALEMVLLAMALTKYEDRKREVALYLMELRKVRPLMDGNGLMALGIEQGPVYGEILRHLLHERLRGHVVSREDEERAAKEYVKGKEF